MKKIIDYPKQCALSHVINQYKDLITPDATLAAAQKYYDFMITDAPDDEGDYFDPLI